MQDRRSGRDRRATNRYSISVDVEWQASAGRQTGTVSDVSFDGCFVLGSAQVQDGEEVKLFIPLADGMKVEFGGRVANHVPDIGFGVKFDKLSAPQRELLTSLVKNAEET
jgi:hypothetical protein